MVLSFSWEIVFLIAFEESPIFESNAADSAGTVCDKRDPCELLGEAAFSDFFELFRDTSDSLELLTETAVSDVFDAFVDTTDSFDDICES